jgi:hypothetical protein
MPQNLTPRKLLAMATAYTLGATAILVAVIAATACLIPAPTPAQRAAFERWEASQAAQKGHGVIKNGEVAP